MTLGFAPGARRGRHYELARFAVNKLKKVNLLVTGSTENAFEHTITSSLQSSPKLSRNLIAGIDKNEVEKITPANLFGFSHKPDLSIGIDGTAIEIKMVSSGQGVRDLIGQAITYRMHYRFVILVLIDQTKDKRLVKLCRSKKTQEFSFLSELANTMNVFTVLGPLGRSKNIGFCEIISRNKVISTEH